MEETNEKSSWLACLMDLQVTENLNSDPLLELCQCPLCQIDCGSREQLIAHVYQVWNGQGSSETECKQFRSWVLQWPLPLAKEAQAVGSGRTHSTLQNILENNGDVFTK